MATMVFRLFDLPWAPVAEDDRRFRAITLSALVLSLLLGALAYWVPLPREERRQVQVLPPRLAQLVIEQRRTPPPPPPPQVEEQPQEEPKPVEPVQEEPKPVESAQETPPKPEPKPEEKPAPVDAAAEARKKAAKSGLLAFADQLADLRDTSVVDALAGNKALNKAEAAAVITRRDLVTAGAGGSGGIDTTRLGSGLTGTTALAGRDTTQVESSVKLPPKPAEDDKTKKVPATPTRTYEEVIRVIDSSKGAIFALYNRALRQNPALQGKVVLEISIAPDGGVTDCKIVSSELGDADLERKLVARIKLLQFGAREVEPMVVTYPIDFLPS